MLLGKTLDQPVDQPLVVVLAAQKGVARGGHYLEHAVVDVEQRHVEGAAAQVEHGDLALHVPAKAIGQGRRGGLVDDADDVQAGDASGVLGGLALAVVEVGGDRDHRLVDGLAEELLGDGAHLLQDVGGNLGRREELVAQLDADVLVRALDQAVGHRRLHRLHGGRRPRPPDQSLDRIGRVLGVGDRLAFRDVADQTLAGLGHRHHRGRGLVPAAIGDDRGADPFKNSDARVGRSKVYADYLLSHGLVQEARSSPSNNGIMAALSPLRRGHVQRR